MNDEFLSIMAGEVENAVHQKLSELMKTVISSIETSWDDGFDAGYSAALEENGIHNVKIKVNSNQDQSRIAKVTIDLLREMAEKHCKTT